MDISLNTHVAEILVEQGRAVGVKLKNGKIIRARKAVVSNATPFDTVKMLPPQDQLDPQMKGYTELKEWRETLGTLPRHGAILHLFVAVDAEKSSMAKNWPTTRRGAPRRTRSRRTPPT